MLRPTAVVIAGVVLLAGCVDVVDRPTLRARPVTLEAPETPDFPGITVRGSLAAQQDGLVVNATARNDGNRTYRIETGCSDPWQDVVFAPQGAVRKQKPEVTCDAFELKDWPPGGVLHSNVTWDGRVWDSFEGLRSAEPGNYTWSVRFVAYQANDVTLKRFDLDFNVTVVD